MSSWNEIIHYVEGIGRYHHVNPAIYLGIHLVASPLFAGSISWILYNKRKNKSLFVPVIVAIILFNTSNLYLIIFGNRIPFWIYAVALCSTIAGGFMAYRKIRKRIQQGHENN